MQSAKLSVSLPRDYLLFIEEYRLAHHRNSRSQVVKEALALLRSRELEQAYREASQEDDRTWDATAGDGLNDETW